MAMSLDKSQLGIGLIICTYMFREKKRVRKESAMVWCASGSVQILILNLDCKFSSIMKKGENII